VAYCELHRLERNIFPTAIAENWPFSPDFTNLFNRIMSLKRTLTAICDEPENSSFFRASKEFYTPKPTTSSDSEHQLPSSAQLHSVMHQYQSTERFHSQGAG
jgi:hypothetical protein